MTTPRYDMPIAFGPSSVPDHTDVPHADVAIVSFLTDEAPLAALLPPGFVLNGDPVLSVSCIDYQGVDYLGGRGYQEIVVSFQARFQEVQGEISGGFAPVLWVSDVGALMAGREFMGLPKLHAKIAHSVDEQTRSFACYEYDTKLLSGKAYDLEPLTPEQVAKVQARSQQVQTFGWKHIPGEGGSVDLAYPLVNVMRWNYQKIWTGKGSVQFATPDAAAAPFSSRAMTSLAHLPVREFRRSFVASGSAKIDRAATRRLA